MFRIQVVRASRQPGIGGTTGTESTLRCHGCPDDVVKFLLQRDSNSLMGDISMILIYEWDDMGCNMM